MKQKFFLRAWLMALLPLALLVACHDKNDEPSNPQLPSMVSTSIEGDWLENSSDKNMISIGEVHYDSDGSFSMFSMIVNTEINEIFNYNGEWSISQDILTETYRSQITGQNLTDRYNLMFCDKYSLIIENLKSTDIAQSDKIVSKRTLSIDETCDFSIEDSEYSEFIPISYSSTNSHVATVDESGHIEALNPGIAYIIASSKIGNVVNKVTVTSPLIIDDYIQYMGNNIKEVTAEFGDIYITTPSEPISERQFFLANPIVQSVTMGYALQKVRMIIVTIRPSFDANEIMTAWDNAFDTSSTSKLVHSYIIERNGEKYLAMLDNSAIQAMLTIISYVEVPPTEYEFTETDFTQFAWLPGTPVIEAATILNYDITFENIEDGFFDTIKITDNNAFDELSVLFETEEEPFPVDCIILRCKKDITEEDLKPWFESVFTPTDDELNPYTYDFGNGNVYVYCKKVGSRLNVYYKTRKRR